jgi:hypothetical protein
MMDGPSDPLVFGPWFSNDEDMRDKSGKLSNAPGNKMHRKAAAS